ncbi:non-heme iron oxygenase ferredoxin subunit [Corynebacterium felinum]|uniref:3-phenylpropionate/trans-cinnamate dioxygenase ferredoxin subunit n=1 Tax=Corynebacterium felinum TaxID=131318 RepID=A0ABU2B7D6_9CORY|nr:non-heme iron oxygenase ferredoxin subunit [Corynebacterium felinum]MDF5820745.1 non-heme iron oxygenase ferredoxin subunit [Corynebacterium felinum]MDR7354206.1 3-phenylpropionate/trans-cinnamate dioxygenase ferredoxin subunit [Corynebacterium felinum]WJY96375.1 3-phenylpropionate/cinnamic acid dioxygenase ferredoxin subunit [Corynebacterium felinum]
MGEPVKVGTIDDIEQEEGIVVESDVTGYDDPIAIFRTDEDEIYALNDTCTHGDASLADGWVEGTEVECPMHSGKFCLKSGKVLCMPAVDDTITHKVEVRDDEIWLYPGTPAEVDDD